MKFNEFDKKLNMKILCRWKCKEYNVFYKFHSYDTICYSLWINYQYYRQYYNISMTILNFIKLILRSIKIKNYEIFVYNIFYIFNNL